MLKHSSGVMNKMIDVFLEGSYNKTNGQTCMFDGLPLWKFQDGVESTAVCQAVTLFVHHVGLCLLCTSSSSKNISDIYQLLYDQQASTLSSHNLISFLLNNLLHSIFFSKSHDFIVFFFLWILVVKDDKYRVRIDG